MSDRFAQPPEEGPDAENVRIIGAEEAQEAMERGDVAPRLSEQEPRPGDRPSQAAEGPRPTLRFPLSDAEDPQHLVRPAVVPPEPVGSWNEGHESWSDQGEHETRTASWDDPGFGAPAAGFGYADEPTWADSGHDTAGQGGWEEHGEQGPSSQPVELPHWTDPPTGEVPRVIASEEGDDLDAWSSFASSTPPRWRDENSDWSEGDYEVSALGDEETRVGALDSGAPHPEDDPFSFEEPEPALVGGGFEDDYDDEPQVRHDRPGRRPLRRPGGGGAGGGGGGRDVQTATLVGAGLGFAALILIGAAPTAIGILAVTAVAVVSAWEFFGVTVQGGARAAALVGMAGAAGLPLGVYWKGPEAIPLILVLALFAALLWYVVGAGGTAPVLEGVGTTLLGVAWIGVLASYAARFLLLPQGRAMLIGVILVVVAADVGAFFGGQSFGQHPLSRVSPNKTIEGALAGLGASVVVGTIIVGAIFKLGAFHGVKGGFLLGLAAGVVAPIGDLCESVIKRDLGVKDMGSLLPGHGGLLDRIDGLLFVLPAAFYLITTFHLSLP